MSTNEKLAILNASLYIGLLIYNLRKNRRVKLSAIILIIYSISAIFTFFFVRHPYFPYSEHACTLTIWPFIYLFITFCLFYYPISRFDENKIISIQSPPLKKLQIVILIFSLLLIIKIVYYLPHAIDLLSNSDSLAINKDLREAGESALDLTFPWGFISYMGTIFSKIGIFLYFYTLTIRSISKVWKIFLGATTMFAELLSGIVITSRATLLFLMLNILISYLLFQKFYPKNIKLAIRTILILFGITASFIIIGVSIARFSEENAYGKGIEYYTYKYFGESFSNFNGILFGKVKEHLWGIRNFSFFAYISGLTDINTIEELRPYAEKLTSVPNYIFYLFIGSLYIDFGGIIVIILAALSAFVANRFFNNTKLPGLPLLLLYFLYYNMVLQGIFYFPYSMQAGNLLLVIALAIYAYFRYRFQNL